MKLFVTCECSHRTPVTPAKCGETIRCVCGEAVVVPPLSQLKTASGVDDQPEAWQGQEDSPHYQDLTPVRYWTFPIILLLFLYAGLLLVRIPIALQSGIFIALMQTGFATVAIVFGILIFRFAVPKQ